MATYILNARQRQKYDDIESWIKNDPVLERGEIAVTVIDTAVKGTANYVPSILFKVGDGEKKFSELDFTYALSADVYAWAKKESLEYGDLPAELISMIDELQESIPQPITNEEIEVLINGE